MTMYYESRNNNEYREQNQINPLYQGDIEEGPEQWNEMKCPVIERVVYIR